MNLKSTKFILSIVAVVLLLAGVGAGVLLIKQSAEFRESAAPATSLSISPSTQAKAAGEEFTFNIDMNTGENKVTSFDITVNFNPQVLQVSSVTKGSFAAGLEQEVRSAEIDNAGGKIRYALFTLNKDSGLQGSGSVITVRGTVKAGATGEANIDFAANTAVGGAGEAGQNVLVEGGKSPGKITVAQAQAPTATPTPTPTPTQAPVGGGATATPTPTPTQAPAGGGATATPTLRPTATPTQAPAGGTNPTATPTSAPASGGTSKPTVTLPANNTVKAGDTLTGTAKANSNVTITIQSDPITATVKADSTGKWSYKIPTTLALGSHTLTITDSNGTTTKTITVAAASSATTAPTAASASKGGDDDMPVSGNSLPTLLALLAGGALFLSGLFVALKKD